MIEITDSISIHEDELVFEFTGSTGPGGQHVNRVATAVQLRFNARKSPGVPENVKERLIALAGKRATSEGVILIRAQRFRSRERNRQDAVERLVLLVKRAAEPPQKRKPTRPSRASKEQRIQEKKKQSEKKRMRKKVPPAPD